MALEHGDLFFVNRSNATYKIEAFEIGEYLINNELNSGGYFVNNGMLSITNTGNPLLTTPIGIHSANSSTNTILDFDDNFIVTRSGSDAAVTLNYPTVMEGLLCTDQNGNTPGFDESNCGCISLDFGYIADRLPCPNYGIVDNNGCLEINRCENGVLGLYGTNEACLDVNICNKGGIINDGGCIRLDYSEIINNVVCDVNSSGLLHDGSCISVNFEKVMAEMGLGKIRADNTIIIRDANDDITNDGDLTVGNVTLSVNPAMYEAPPINNILAEGCLVINGNANLTTGDVKINLDEPCLIALINKHSGGGSGGGGVSKIIAGTNITISPTSGVGDVTINSTAGTGSGGISLCGDSGLILGTDGCIAVDYTDAAPCPKYPKQQITGQKIVAQGPGTGGQPAFIMNANSSNKGWVGFKTNTGTMSLSVTAGDEYIEDDCGGKTDASSAEHRFKLFEIVPGGRKYTNNSGNIQTTPSIFKTHGISNIATPSAKNVRVFRVDDNCGNDDDDEDKCQQVGGGPRDNALCRFTYNQDTFKRGELEEVDRSFDTRVNIDIDQALEAIGGYSDDPDTTGGLLRWGLKVLPQSETLNHPLRFPYCFIDAEELATVLPSFVDYYAPNERFDSEFIYEKDEDGNDTDEVDIVNWTLKPDTTIDDLLPMEINSQALMGLAMAGLLRYKKKNEGLETRLAALEARLDAAGIP